MKSGVNFEDRNAINRLSAEGLSSSEIADALKIDSQVVARFMPQQDKPKRRGRPPKE